MNISDIELTYSFLAHERETEIRLVDPHKVTPPKSVFVSSKEEFVKACSEANGTWNVYAGINERKTNGTMKEDVLSVKTLVIDIDPERPKDTASTEQELTAAKEVAFNIEQSFVNLGFERPAKAMSGNGVQLWFAFPKIDITPENRNEIEGKVKKFIYTLQKKYNSPKVKIDQIGDLPRIIKVMGTKSIKGTDTPERPQRVAEWLFNPGRKEDSLFRAELLKLEPILPTETIVQPLTDKKESRSEVEFGAICKLIKQGLSKEEIFNKMMAYAKWATAHSPQYREYTYKNAIEATEKELVGTKQILIPGYGKLISEFTKEICKELKGKNDLFYRVDAKEIIEIGKIKVLDAEEETYTGFLEVKPSRFITILEKHIEPGSLVKNKRTDQIEFKSKSISSELAATILASEILQKSLPQIQRIFTIPLPILYKGEMCFPNKGYDPRFGSWLQQDAPDITEPEMSLEQAKEIFKNIFFEFCFQTQQDYYNAVAALITPFLRGLFPTFSTRTPVYFYLANRERAGKDYLAGITGIVYEGYDLQEAPLCNSEKGGNNSEELRKKFLAALIGGRKRMHFSNNKGYIDNAVFEAITTTEKYSDRILGKNENVIFANEIDFSLSGNVGVGFTPDFANRCRFIRLFLEMENANERQFSNPNLHQDVLQRRGLILSAMYALVRNWKDKGMTAGTLNFSSYPSWAKICGGVMEAAGYGNPCVIEKDITTVAGDSETQDMKLLFEKCNETWEENKVNKKAIIQMVQDLDLFGYWDLENNRADQTKFGNLLTRYDGRNLSGIRMIGTIKGARSARQEYVFTRKSAEVTLINF